MSTIWVECWKCDVCGHRWIKTEKWPATCAKKACRSRKWNGLGQAGLPPRTDKPIQFFRTELPVETKVDLPAKPSMNDLRDICAGKAPIMRTAPPDVEKEEIPICMVDWWEDGEHYECLMDKGHRSVKHGLHGMVSTLDQ